MYNPNYVITNSVLNSIGQIEAAKAIIENSPLIPLYERQFKAEATIRKVHYSTAIEGNYLELNEVRRIVTNPSSEDNIDSVHGYLKKQKDVHGNEIIARSRDIHEVINYRKLVSYIEELMNSISFEKGFVLTEDHLFDMHKILLKNILEDRCGKYRQDKAVSVNFVTGEKLNLYDAPELIEPNVADLISWYNSDLAEDIHPVLKAGILHLQIARIHPFEEANGRMARALATLSLTVDGYSIKNFFCLDEYYDSNAADYYKYLNKGFKDLTEWLEYFTLGMAIEFNRVKERVFKISKDASIKEKTGQVYISERQEKIIEWLNAYGYFRNQDFTDLFPDISDDTVLRELKGLMEAGVVVKKGKTKSARYELVSV